MKMTKFTFVQIAITSCIFILVFFQHDYNGVTFKATLFLVLLGIVISLHEVINAIKQTIECFK